MIKTIVIKKVDESRLRAVRYVACIQTGCCVFPHPGSEETNPLVAQGIRAKSCNFCLGGELALGF